MKDIIFYGFFVDSKKGTLSHKRLSVNVILIIDLKSHPDQTYLF